MNKYIRETFRESFTNYLFSVSMNKYSRCFIENQFCLNFLSHILRHFLTLTILD